jgi:hypothetical protein
VKYKGAIKAFVIGVLSLIIAVAVTHNKGEVWEEKVRFVLYKVKNDSVPNYAVEHVDNKGVPYVYYPEQNGITAGNQYNATIVANYAIDYYKNMGGEDTSIKTKFRNCIDWLIRSITYKNGYALYQFNWQQPWYPKVKAPFTSGMTSGRAIEAFSYAFQQTKDSSYMNHARALIKGFYLPVQEGGFTYKETNGWWYEEVADASLQTPRILDGHIYAIWGVRTYWQLTEEDSAAKVMNLGLDALKHRLSEYDGGNGKIYYDASHKPADKKYRKILLSQMKQLYDATHDDVFLNYYNKWSVADKKPYVLKVVSERNISGIILVLLLTVFFSIVIVVLLRMIATARK